MRWLAAELVEARGTGVSLVAAMATPMCDSRGAAQAEASAKLRYVWASLGFQEVGDSAIFVNPTNPNLQSTYTLPLQLS